MEDDRPTAFDPIDKLGEYFNPNLFFSYRVIFLACSLIFTGLWIEGGWDATIQWTIFRERYGTGIHWSTLQGFAIVMYLGLVNFQRGGKLSPKALFHAVRHDFYALRNLHRFKRIRQDYEYNCHTVEPIRAALTVFFIATAGLFFFENIWVLFYNYFQFGDWMWPVYHVEIFANFSTAMIFWRNVLHFAFPLTLAVGCLGLAGKGGVLRYKIRFRLDRKALIFGLLFVGALGFWVYYPLPHNVSEFDDLEWDDFQQFDEYRHITLKRELWIFPRQDLFPQTSYTMYPAESYMVEYEAVEIVGFHVLDDGVHGMNVLVKYLGFLVVGYPLMFVIERRKEDE